MTITLDTMVRGSVDITAQQILRRLDSDPRPHIYSDADRREIAEKIIAWASVFGARASLNAAQIIHETGAFRYGGQVKPEQWNFAGIGATNDGAAGASFPNIDTGVLAYFCHWALYVYGHPDNWPEHLRKHRQWAIRLGPVQSAGYLGVIKIMRDWTNGRWAWSPQYPRGSLLNGYAQAIVNGANRIRELKEEEPPVSDLTTTIMNRIKAHGVEIHDIRDQLIQHATKRYQVQAKTAWTHLAVHYTAGGTANPNNTLQQDIARWQAHARHHVNTQGWPGIAYALGFSPSGRAFVLRDVRLRGFHAGNANSYALGIAGDYASGQKVTQKSLETAAVIAHVLFHETPEFPNLKQANARGHRDFMSTACPGNELYAWVQKLARGEVDLPGRDAPDTPVNEIVDPVTNKRIIGGFKGRYEAVGNLALAVFGRPLTNEVKATVDGVERTVQRFERAVLAWYPENQPHGVPSSNPMHVRSLTLAEAQDVLDQIE